MSGSFKQTDSDGNISTGKFYFLKPYQSKFEYSNKSENIITNQRLLRVVDEEGYQLDSYPISGNFLKQILSDEIHLTDEFNIKDFLHECCSDFSLNCATPLEPRGPANSRGAPVSFLRS